MAKTNNRPPDRWKKVWNEEEETKGERKQYRKAEGMYKEEFDHSDWARVCVC